MFCPQCGTALISPDQRFCKTCGANVALVSQILNAPPASVIQPVSPAVSTTAGGPLTPSLGADILANFQESASYRITRRIGWALILGGALFIPSCGIIGGVLDRQPELSALGVPIILLGVALSLFARLTLKKPKPPQVIVLQAPTAQPVAPEQTTFSAPPLLPPEPLPFNPTAPPPSVTENTTRNLETPYRYKTQP
jgi:hypothetical protein